MKTQTFILTVKRGGKTSFPHLEARSKDEARKLGGQLLGASGRVVNVQKLPWNVVRYVSR